MSNFRIEADFYAALNSGFVYPRQYRAYYSRLKNIFTPYVCMYINIFVTNFFTLHFFYMEQRVYLLILIKAITIHYIALFIINSKELIRKLLMYSKNLQLQISQNYQRANKQQNYRKNVIREFYALFSIQLSPLF
jgi:hypothetical protein